jgi:hypothetical protein
LENVYEYLPELSPIHEIEEEQQQQPLSPPPIEDQQLSQPSIEDQQQQQQQSQPSIEDQSSIEEEELLLPNDDEDLFDNIFEETQTPILNFMNKLRTATPPPPITLNEIQPSVHRKLNFS